MDYSKLSISELKEAKADISAILKDRSAEAKEEAKTAKAELKAEATAEGKDIAKVGEKISTTFKGEDVIGTITKISDKTVTIKLADLDGNDIVNPENGKVVSTWKYFYQIKAIA